MIILHVIIFSVILALVFLTIFRVVINKNLQTTSKIFNILIFICVLFLLAQWTMGYIFHQTLKRKKGYVGEKGIEGRMGEEGDKATCSTDCGRKVCFAVLRTTMNQILQETIEKDIPGVEAGSNKDRLKKLLTCIKEPPIVKDEKNQNRITEEIDGLEAKKDGKCVPLSSLTTQQILNDKNIDLTYSIKNKKFLNKINTLCNSKQYLEILERQPPSDDEGNQKEKPTEKKLILFLSKIIEKWIKTICDFRIMIKNPETNKMDEVPIGILYLMSSDADYSMIETIEIRKRNNEGKVEKKEIESPLREVEKYDVWHWGEENSESPLLIKKCIQNITPPLGSEQQLKTILVNDYETIFSLKDILNNDTWDITNCPYGQMGDDLSNPHNLKYCVFREEDISGQRKGLIRRKLAWKTKEYRGRKLNITFLHPRFTIEVIDGQERRVYHKNINGKLFYPVGSVWTSLNVDNVKINKKTILVSGDVLPPTSYINIWSSSENSNDDLSKHVKLWRPVPPDGYIALGDVATKANETPDTTFANTPIVCVSKRCLELDKPLTGSKIWSNQDFSTIEYVNEENYRIYNNLSVNRSLKESDDGNDLLKKDKDDDINYPRNKMED